MTASDFKTFRDDGRLKQMSATAAAKQDTSNSTPATGPSTQSTPVVGDRTSTFGKGIRRDARAFKVISDDKQFDTWKRYTLATATAQGVAEVLDPDYKPTTSDDVTCF